MPTFTERQEHKIEVLPPYSVLQVRTADIVERDGIEVGRTYERYVRSPGDDITNEPAEVQAIANALWTEQLIADYAAIRNAVSDVTPEPTPEPSPAP